MTEAVRLPKLTERALDDLLNRLEDAYLLAGGLDEDRQQEQDAYIAEGKKIRNEINRRLGLIEGQPRTFRVEPAPHDMKAGTDAEGVQWKRHPRYRRQWHAASSPRLRMAWEDLVYHYGPIVEVRDEDQ